MFSQHLPFASLLTALFASTGTARWVAVLAALVLLAFAALWSGTRAREADVLATFLVVRAWPGGGHARLFTVPGGRSARQLTALTNALHASARHASGAAACVPSASKQALQGVLAPLTKCQHALVFSSFWLAQRGPLKRARLHWRLSAKSLVLDFGAAEQAKCGAALWLATSVLRLWQGIALILFSTNRLCGRRRSATGAAWGATTRAPWPR